jgi:hypothetical protein
MRAVHVTALANKFSFFVSVDMKCSKSENGKLPISETTLMNCIAHQGVARGWYAQTTFCQGA